VLLVVLVQAASKPKLTKDKANNLTFFIIAPS
jgi:hypothetical protein